MAEIFCIKSFIRKRIFYPKDRLMLLGAHNRFLKAAVCFLLPALLLLASLPALASGVPDGMVIRDGMAQPIAAYTDAASLDYTNEDSDILRFVVYVETDHDTDLDGKADLVKTLVQVPRAASEGRYAAPALYEARPYIAGMYGYNPTLMPVGEASFDEACLYTEPEKRVPSQETTTLLHAKSADPSDWYYHLDSDPFDQQYMGNLTAYDYYLVRGFAIIQAAGLGTWGSEGILCCGSDLEAEAFACVVEWLTGDRAAYTDRTNNVLVRADFCSGKVGMTGRSYAGAMAFEVASTGVPGLETIVPVAAPASWYDYANSQGIPSGLLSGYDALADLSIMCASRFFEPVGEALRAHYETYLSHLRDEQIALRGDYGAFWEKRDFSKRTGFKASALIVQGLNDDTVHPRHFDLMRSALLKNGCEVKCLLHQNGHVTPASEQTKTDIMIGGHTYTEWLNLWFTHYLLGVENEAAVLPDITVQSNIDGTFYGTDQWNTGYAMTFSPEDAEEYTLCAKGAHFSNVTLLNEVFDGTSGDDHLLWKMPVTEELTINGPAEVHLRVRTEDVDKNMLMLGAVLVESADEAFPCFDVGAIGVLGREVVAEGGVDRGEGTEPYDLVIWPQTMQSRKIISYGSMDLRNPEAGYDSASAMRRQEPIEAGTWYDVVLYLQSALHTVPAGHYLELYIVPFCGFSDDAATYDSYSPEELEGMGLLPEALVPFTRDYSFTVDNAGSFASIPLFYTRDRI